MSKANVLPDFYTIPIVMKAVCQSFDVQAGLQVHCVAIKLGLDLKEFCESGFISLYSKAGDFGNAKKVFEQSPERKLGSWNAVIGGLTRGGQAEEAINMFMELLKSGLEPDDVTMVSVTSACGSLGDLNLALQLHKCVFQAKRFGKSDMMMMNSLIDMYGKCGRMELAYKVFVGMAERNVLTWTSLIMGYAMHGDAVDALECFHYMRKAGVRPNHVTFIGVLSACVHGGRVEEGRRYFDMMVYTYRITPMLQHYGVMVDLLGRAGLLNEAREMVESMPMDANVIIWGALMGACEKHGNVEMGEWVAKHLEELEPWNDGVYVVLSNIYARVGMWEDVERVRMIMKTRKIAKSPAYSSAALSV
ncbi:Pentatricopeptide repeat-containing protein [Thalictrum thalictroides]|uniref:Pentatricopeptide repeat-containing protein n=1 Tax=Thalictrum thalictroides TaxID=46969 RepID=A0A7J6UUM7_THATH|nr:Pentatricopeptide repeat-containing protein [Thalictrum thalictroides]